MRPTVSLVRTVERTKQLTVNSKLDVINVQERFCNKRRSVLDPRRCWGRQRADQTRASSLCVLCSSTKSSDKTEPARQIKLIEQVWALCSNNKLCMNLVRLWTQKNKECSISVKLTKREKDEEGGSWITMNYRVHFQRVLSVLRQTLSHFILTLEIGAVGSFALLQPLHLLWSHASHR